MLSSRRKHKPTEIGLPEILLTIFRSLSGKPVCFRFHLTRGSLYAFWVTPDRAGASYGYVAGSGPGLKGPIDLPGGGTK